MQLSGQLYFKFKRIDIKSHLTFEYTEKPKLFHLQDFKLKKILESASVDVIFILKTFIFSYEVYRTV